MANPTQLFRRNATWRKGIIRSLATDVIIYGKIQTTEVKAKEIKRHVEKLITRAKKGTLAQRRKAEAFLRPVKAKNGQAVGTYLFNTLGSKYKSRSGGYTRIIKAPSRKGDNSKMAILELV